jgi:hypothetical protein
MYKAPRDPVGSNPALDFFRRALTELDSCRSRQLCRANRRVVEILVRGRELRRFIQKIV